MIEQRERSSERLLLLLLVITGAQLPVAIATIAVEQRMTSISPPSMVESDGVGCGRGALDRPIEGRTDWSGREAEDHLPKNIDANGDI